MSQFLKSLKKLLKIKSHAIERLRQQMSFVSGQIEARNAAIEKNLSHINTERLIASVNIIGSDTFQLFISRKIGQNKIYSQEICELKETLDDIKKQLLNLYIEQKKIERVETLEKDKLDMELNRKEIEALDEVATQTYLLNLTKNLIKYKLILLSINILQF